MTIIPLFGYFCIVVSSNFKRGSSCSAGGSSSFERGCSFKVVNSNMNNSPSFDDVKAQFVNPFKK